MRLEVQVKGASGTVTLEALASYLAHTPARRADHTLLERLIADTSRMAVLVMSGRANDAVSVYVVGREWVGEPHPAKRISASHAKALLDAFAVAEVAGNDTGALKGQRQLHNAALAKSANIAIVREALSRLVIIEQVDEAELESRCAEHLRRAHAIPSDHAPDLLRRLRGVVKMAKSRRCYAFPSFREVLTSASPPPIRPINYVPRGVETDLEDALSLEGVLLLSGTPRVGKSFVARWLAADFMDAGYEVQEFSDAEGAERFLLDPGAALRLAVLDDPLGGSYVSPEAARSLARIERLISRLTIRRKLIVAQGLEPLLATARATSLDDVKTAKHSWRDMGTFSPTFLAAVWNSLASTFGVDERLDDLVKHALMAGAAVIEPGCLEHLAANAFRLPSRFTLDEVIRLAREDALQLGRALAAEGLEDLTITLALTTAPREPIAAKELAFARGEGGALLPGKPAKDFLISCHGSPLTESPSPAYDECPALAKANSDALDALERRRLIRIEMGSSAGFAHPFYRAAAETLLDGPTHRLAVSAVRTVERGLFCLSPLTSRATARNLEWIFSKLGPRSEARRSLIQQAIEGLKSFFSGNT